MRTNVNGVHNLLELIRGKYEYERPVLIQISTDEVYGDISDGKHREEDLLKPSNPYSASKASADMLVMAWGRTYGIEYKITRSTNNYGIRQYPEKIIPKFIKLLLEGKNVPIHGSGEYVRDWLHVKDNCEAILFVINEGEENSIYNIAGECEMTNLELTKKILKFFNKGEGCIDFVPNRWGQDIRYSLDISKIKKLGWRSTRDFDEELEKLINWWRAQFTNERLKS
jgi:dTDP-glucose 4,6-dehydratase